jgi:hypothetical protein
MHANISQVFQYRKTSAPVVFQDLNLKSTWKCLIKFKENELTPEETLEISFNDKGRAFAISEICRDILELKGKRNNDSFWKNCANFSEDHLRQLSQSLIRRKDEIVNFENIRETHIGLEMINDEFVVPSEGVFLLKETTFENKNVNLPDSDSGDSACITLSYETMDNQFEGEQEESRIFHNKVVEPDEMKRNKIWWIFNESIFKRNEKAASELRTRINNNIALGFHEMNCKLWCNFLKSIQEQFYWETEYYINPNTGKYYFTYHLDLMWGIFSDEQIKMTRIHVANQKIIEPILWNEEHVVEMARVMKSSRITGEYL